MKKFLLAPAFLICTIYGFSQSLSHVTLTGATTLLSFAFTSSDQALVRVSPDGNIIDWGMEFEQGRMGYYQGKLTWEG
jgi:hypothetical protein